MENKMSSPAWPHGPFQEIFPDIFFVTGTNITEFNQVTYQHSRNMVIVREQNKLSLINTVTLTDDGLAALAVLGKIENVIRIGAFHGRDDAFYRDQYQAKLWALPGMDPSENILEPNGAMPFQDCSLFTFNTSIHPEGILHIAREGGILVACDSIKNWLAPDEFFSTASAEQYQQQGFFGVATISPVWQQACQVKPKEFTRLKTLTFKHLLSAHGEPLLNNAYAAVSESIERVHPGS